MSTLTAATLAKGLRLLSALVADEGRSSLSVIARGMAIPLPTAHRLALTLEAEGYIVRGAKGYFHRGPALAVLGAEPDTARQAVSRLRRPLVRLAEKYRAFVHFGVLEDGMVTYLLKESGAGGELFTQERKQLEAYCSAVGKVLLAALPRRDLDAYLAGGPFVAITRQTITAPGELRRELDEVRATGAAFDRFEVRDDLFCVGVPVRAAGGAVIGAISASLVGDQPVRKTLGQLRRALDAIAGSYAGKML